MKTIISGSRNCTDNQALQTAIQRCGWVPTVILSGGAAGADALGELWAAQNGLPCWRYPAEWNRHGKAAGPMRNVAMAKDADALIALWDGNSPGTRHMISTAQRAGLRVHVEKIGEQEPELW